MDVCTSGVSPCGRQDFECGQLERHVVVWSDADKWMGMAAYSLARDNCGARAMKCQSVAQLLLVRWHRKPKKQVLRSTVESE